MKAPSDFAKRHSLSIATWVWCQTSVSLLVVTWVDVTQNVSETYTVFSQTPTEVSEWSFRLGSSNLVFSGLASSVIHHYLLLSSESSLKWMIPPQPCVQAGLFNDKHICLTKKKIRHPLKWVSLDLPSTLSLHYSESSDLRRSAFVCLENEMENTLCSLWIYVRPRQLLCWLAEVNRPIFSLLYFMGVTLKSCSF